MDIVQKARDELTVAALTLVDAEEALEEAYTAHDEVLLRGAVLEVACNQEYEARLLVMKAKDKLFDVARAYVKAVRGQNLHELQRVQEDIRCEYVSGEGFRCVLVAGHRDAHTWGVHDMKPTHFNHGPGTYKCTRCGATSGDPEGRNVGPCFPDEMVDGRKHTALEKVTADAEVTRREDACCDNERAKNAELQKTIDEYNADYGEGTWLEVCEERGRLKAQLQSVEHKCENDSEEAYEDHVKLTAEVERYRNLDTDLTSAEKYVASLQADNKRLGAHVWIDGPDGSLYHCARCCISKCDDHDCYDTCDAWSARVKETSK